MKILAFLITALWVICAQAQINDFETETFEISDKGVIILSMDASPDGSELAISTFQGKLLFLDANDFSKLREFDVSGFANGGRVAYSQDGRYIVMKKIRMADWNINKDTKQRIIVLDSKSGEKVVDHDAIYDLDISPDGETYAIMDKGHLKIRSMTDGNKIADVMDDRLQSSITYGPKGDLIYASRGFDKSDLKKDPRFKKNKKGMKAFSKFQQTVVGYDVNTGEPRFISPDNMDEIYDMRCSRRGDCILIYAKQDLRVNAIGSTNFVLQMGLSNGMLLREQFNSKLMDPDYKENLKKDIIGITTTEDMDRSQSVLLYNRSTNEIIAKFDIDSRFLEGIFQGKVLDGGASFDFSEDGRHLLVGIGNMLYRWKIKEVD
jgi:hypothetical protein